MRHHLRRLASGWSGPLKSAVAQRQAVSLMGLISSP